MTRRLMRSNINNEDDSITTTPTKQNSLTLCNGHTGRTITRQTSQELLKVQCNGIATGHRNSKLLSPSGSDVLPLPTSRRSKRRASASWCGSTRELSQLSPTDGEIENIRRSESSFETNDSSLDSPGITLRPKGQLWLPVALIGTTAEENGNSIRKRYEYSAKQSDNAKFCNFIIDSLNSKTRNNGSSNQSLSRASKGSDSSLNSSFSDQNDYQIKRSGDMRETHCVITRNAKVKGDNMNGKSRESSVESHKSVQETPKYRADGKKRSLSVGGNTTSAVKRSRAISANSVCSGVRKKKLSPEEKLLQDNKEYFKMEVLSVKLRSSGSLLNSNKELCANVEAEKQEKIEKIIIKKIKGKKKKSTWAKSNERKNDTVYTTVVPQEKTDIKLNGIIRKKRQSELTKLCDEAESFMFGESTRQEILSMNEDNLEDSVNKSLNENGEDMSVSGASEAGESDKRRKKRRSHAEAFIRDNIDYYKFETPGSRLRYQGSFINSKHDSTNSVYPQKEKSGNGETESDEKPDLNVKVEPENTMEKKKYPVQPSEEIEKLLFSFENIPTMEPWYNVYKRQDEGMENYYPLLSDPNDQPFLLPYELPRSMFSRVPEMSDYYKKKKKKLVQLFNHPRKSPRCHASTLAILSSLKKRKRRSGTNISASSMLSDSPQTNNNTSGDEKTEVKQQEIEPVESEELLNFLHEDEPVEDKEMVILEPLSDSESSVKFKASDKNGVSEDELKLIRTGNRSRKTRLESQTDLDVAPDDGKQFCFQNIETDSFFDEMVIETQKKSGLSLSVATLLENFRNYTIDDVEVDIISEFGGSSVADGLDMRRKKKKARKINKTGWDNKKSRRRIGNKVNESKVNGDSVSSKPKRKKTKVKLRQYGIDEDNIIMSSKRRLRNNQDDKKPLLRSRMEVQDRCGTLRSSSQDSDGDADGSESNSVDNSPPVNGKKGSESRHCTTVRIRCANGFGIQNRLVIKKTRKGMDYSWASKRR